MEGCGKRLAFILTERINGWMTDVDVSMFVDKKSVREINNGLVEVRFKHGKRRFEGRIEGNIVRLKEL